MPNIFAKITRVSLLLGMLTCLPPAAISAEDALQVAFAKYCYRCHRAEDTIEGNVDLTQLRDNASLKQRPELLSTLVKVLDSSVMPPTDATLPDGTRRQMVQSLQKLLQQAIREHAPQSRTSIRRMTRLQYNNAVQDLFQLKVDVFALPERMLRAYGYFHPEKREMPLTLKAGSRPLGKSQLIDRRLAGVAPFPQDLRAENGFDNRADHLTLSPLLAQSFLKLGHSIVQSPDFQGNCGRWNDFFVTDSEEDAQSERLRDRLSSFLTMAFRSPPDEPDMDRYLHYIESQLNSGVPLSDCLKSVAAAVVSSPRFLYLYDRTNARQDAHEFNLASRLSFFLWGSIPDQTLLRLAGKKTLSHPRVLAEQVDRMLDDDRLKRFCDSFAPQWLQLERIISSVPDPQRFPDFYFAKFRVSMHMMLEPLLLFETILIEDRPVTELIDPSFSYRSELLESWYRDGKRGQKTPPTGIPFRRVNIENRREGGVITNAAVMTMTSGPTRTQPITRGAWVSAVIFNDPPKPPPADVPPLAEDETDTEKLTLRERLDRHRNQAACAACHVKIDPLGFALENYSPVGTWRDEYDNGRSVDSTGTLFRRHSFTNPAEFKDAILAEKERFIHGFTRHLLSFALGRDLTLSDVNAVDSIMEQAAQNDYRFRHLIKAVVLSQPFRASGNPSRNLVTAESQDLPEVDVKETE